MDRELYLLKKIYLEAKRRCNNPNHKQYLDYGGRGITFKFKSFDEFLNAVGTRPKNYQLDRINNDGHYEVGNVRWATAHQNSINTRTYKNNTSTIKGVRFKQQTGQWVARGQHPTTKKEILLYCGKDKQQAIEARQFWEEFLSV